METTRFVDAVRADLEAAAAVLTKVTGNEAAVDAPNRSAVAPTSEGVAGLADVARALADEGIEAILHCAARSLVGESMQDPARYYRDNVAGGIALLEAARATRVDRVVFSSTAAVYGVPASTPIDEHAPLVRVLA